MMILINDYVEDIKMDKFNIDKQQMKKSHDDAANHHQKAAEYHTQASKHHDADEHEKGHAAANKAHGHAVHAMDNAAKASKQGVGIKTDPQTQQKNQQSQPKE